MAISAKVRVELAERSYEVVVGVDLLEAVGDFVWPFARGRRTVVITDTVVGLLYAQRVSGGLTRAGCRNDVIVMPAGERHKNLQTYGEVVNRLLGLSPPIDRRTLIVALGGGVVGDLAGFVAATALRGLNFVMVPTTLLADVDASVGGKTGLDAPAGKNLIGAFHQPRAVIIDAAALKTLPAGELQNGLAECLKHALIADAGLLDFIEQQAECILSAEPAALADLITRNVAIKARVVSSDERESGRRAHLNFGHTIGHAVETAGGYQSVSHGQAVALGMVAACRIALARGLISPDLARRLTAALSRLHLPTGFGDLPGLPPSARDPARLQEIMAHDKKARGGAARFVLPTGLGSVAIYDDVSGQEIAAALAGL